MVVVSLPCVGCSQNYSTLRSFYPLFGRRGCTDGKTWFDRSPCRAIAPQPLTCNAFTARIKPIYNQLWDLSTL